MWGYLFGVKSDDGETADKIDSKISRLKHPDLEVTDTSGKPINIHMSTEDFKKKNFLALVSTIPMVIGLMVGIVLSQHKQQIRKKALEAVKISAVPRCVDNYVAVDVDVFVSSGSYKIALYPDFVTGTRYLGRLDQNSARLETFYTDLSAIGAGVVEYTLVDGDNVVEERIDYPGLICGE